jgi:plastocyanin
MKRFRSTVPLFLMITGLFFANMAGCGGEDSAGPPACPAPTNTTHRKVVLMKDNFFDPKDITIARGDTIVWFSAGTMAHTTTSGTPGNLTLLWNSGSPQASWVQPCGSFERVFDDTVGTFPYFCIPHAVQQMVGSVTVTP